MNTFSATGNLGKDCRVNQTTNSTVCGFALAVKSGYGDNAQTLWIDCSVWGKQAESRLPEYLVKGQQVAVSGELGQREHEGKNYLTLRVNSIDLIGGKSENSAPAQQPQRQQNQGGYNQQQPNPRQSPVKNNEPDFSYDDSIPF